MGQLHRSQLQLSYNYITFYQLQLQLQNDQLQLQLQLQVGLYRIVHFNIRPNTNNLFYYSAEYE